MYQSADEQIQLKSTLNKPVHMASPWKPKQLTNRGEKIEICNVTQAIHVDSQKMESIIDDNITAIIFNDIHHFKATHAIIYSDGKYIDIDIKQVRHTILADIQKHETIKANLDFMEEAITIIEPINFRGHVMGINSANLNDPVTYLEWIKS